MIAIKLRAGLGNNLFQYAAARTLAERRGYDFCYFPLRSANYYWRAFRKGLSRLRGRDRSPMRKQIAQADIGRYFTLGGERWLRGINQQPVPHCHQFGACDAEAADAGGRGEQHVGRLDGLGDGTQLLFVARAEHDQVGACSLVGVGPLDRIVEAHRYMEAQTHIGKIVVTT